MLHVSTHHNDIHHECRRVTHTNTQHELNFIMQSHVLNMSTCHVDIYCSCRHVMSALLPDTQLPCPSLPRPPPHSPAWMGQTSQSIVRYNQALVMRMIMTMRPAIDTRIFKLTPAPPPRPSPSGWSTTPGRGSMWQPSQTWWRSVASSSRV